MKKTLSCLSACTGFAAFAALSLAPVTTQAAVLAAVPAGQKGALEALNQAISPERAIHQRIELYGTLRMSVDYSDSDVSENQLGANPLLTDGAVSVSSNTSMIGFRGMLPINDRYRMLWQYETQLDVDHVDDGDVWATRNSFLGVEGPLGALLVGRVNTPFKSMGVAYTGYFSTTVADAHAILGASSGGGGVPGNPTTPVPRLDMFGANSLTWKWHKGSLSFQAQYSADQQLGSTAEHAVDDNDNASYSAWVRWRSGAFDLNAAWIRYEQYLGQASLSAYRVSAKYKIGAATVGALYENIETGDSPLLTRLERPAYGVQVAYNILPRWIALAEWNHAEETDIGDDQADQYGVALFHPINRNLLLHVAYTTTRNGDNAAYRGVAFAHGDHVGTLPGHDPQSVSVGAQLSF